MRLLDKKGLSPVIASIILCSAVIIIGLSVWSFTYSVTNSLRDSYYEGIQRDIDKIGERFSVDHVAYIPSHGSLYVWVYNYGNITDYGDIDIVVDVYVWGDGGFFGEMKDTTIPKGEIRNITVSFNEAPSPGSELAVKVYSRRQNVAYQTYVVPS